MWGRIMAFVKKPSGAKSAGNPAPRVITKPEVAKVEAPKVVPLPSPEPITAPERPSAKKSGKPKLLIAGYTHPAEVYGAAKQAARMSGWSSEQLKKMGEDFAAARGDFAGTVGIAKRYFDVDGVT